MPEGWLRTKIGNAIVKACNEILGGKNPDRTHLQDALPVTIGHEFTAYAVAIQNGREQLESRSRRLEELALGGTAVGTGVNAHPRFKKVAIAELSKMAGLKLRAAQNPFEAL